MRVILHTEFGFSVFEDGIERHYMRTRSAMPSFCLPSPANLFKAVNVLDLANFVKETTKMTKQLTSAVASTGGESVADGCRVSA